MAWRRRLLPVGLVLALVAMSGSAAAATQTVDTPAGTFYVVEDHERDGPNPHVHFSDILCISDTGFEFCVQAPFPHAHTGAGVELGVFEETNGCDGLQTEAGDCDGDGDTEDPDSRIASEDRRVDL